MKSTKLTTKDDTFTSAGTEGPDAFIHAQMVKYSLTPSYEGRMSLH